MNNLTNFGHAVEAAGYRCDGDITTELAKKFGICVRNPSYWDSRLKQELMTFANGIGFKCESNSSFYLQLNKRGLDKSPKGVRKLYYDFLGLSESEINQDEGVLKAISTYLKDNPNVDSETLTNKLKSFLNEKESLGRSYSEGGKFKATPANRRNMQRFDTAGSLDDFSEAYNKSTAALIKKLSELSL